MIHHCNFEELKRRDVTVSGISTINADIDILERSCQNTRGNFNKVILNPIKIEALVVNLRQPGIAAAINRVSIRRPLAVSLTREGALTNDRPHREVAIISSIE